MLRSCVRVARALPTQFRPLPGLQSKRLLQSQVRTQVTAAGGTHTVTLAEAQSMPKDLKHFPNDVLLMLSVQGDASAREEIVIREIMSVDSVDWEGAQPRLKEIETAAKSGLGVAQLPYKIGIGTAVVGGLVTFPLCFDLNTALWFNELYVTTDVAEAKDLETCLEVGSWTWNWMEPPLGQLSFFLLTLQYARAQMQNIGLQPYTEWLCGRRAESLSTQFPQYNSRVLSDYSHSTWSK